jgi:hypothetical protein
MPYLREATLEQYLVADMKKPGGIAYKFVFPARKTMPDRIVLLLGEQ